MGIIAGIFLGQVPPSLSLYHLLISINHLFITYSRPPGIRGMHMANPLYNNMDHMDTTCNISAVGLLQLIDRSWTSSGGVTLLQSLSSPTAMKPLQRHQPTQPTWSHHGCHEHPNSVITICNCFWTVMNQWWSLFSTFSTTKYHCVSNIAIAIVEPPWAWQYQQQH